MKYVNKETGDIRDIPYNIKDENWELLEEKKETVNKKPTRKPKE